jgi:hypothetical protein
MRRDPRTGQMILEPGDPGYTPYSSDGGYFAYNMGYGVGYAPTYDPYTGAGQDFTGAGTRLQDVQDASRRARERAQQARPAQQNQPIDVPVSQVGGFDPFGQDAAFEADMASDTTFMARPTDRRDAMGRLISEFDVKPDDDEFNFDPLSMSRTEREMRQANPSLNNEAQQAVDSEVAEIDEILGDSLRYGGGQAREVRDMSIDTPEATEGQDAAAKLGTGLGQQLAVAGLVGGLQAAAPFFFGNRAREEAEASVERLGDGGAAREGEEAARELREEGRAQINRAAQRSRAVQEDIAAAGGATDVRRQVQIRDAASRAMQEGEAELEIAARQLAQQVTSEGIAEYRSALSYLDQSDNARLQGIFNLLGGLASVKAQVDVNTGIKELSPDIAKLPTQYQNMFANLSFNAKSQQDVARAYAYVQRLAANAGQTPS